MIPLCSKTDANHPLIFMGCVHRTQMVFLALDLPQLLLWGAIMGALAIIPVLGAFLI